MASRGDGEILMFLLLHSVAVSQYESD